MARPAHDRAADLARQATAGRHLSPADVTTLARAYLRAARDLDAARRILGQLREPVHLLRDGLAAAHDAYEDTTS